MSPTPDCEQAGWATRSRHHCRSTRTPSSGSSNSATGAPRPGISTSGPRPRDRAGVARRHQDLAGYAAPAYRSGTPARTRSSPPKSEPTAPSTKRRSPGSANCTSRFEVRNPTLSQRYRNLRSRSRSRSRVVSGRPTSGRHSAANRRQLRAQHVHRRYARTDHGNQGGTTDTSPTWVSSATGPGLWRGWCVEVPGRFHHLPVALPLIICAYRRLGGSAGSVRA